jgi:hypothetical protein
MGRLTRADEEDPLPGIRGDRIEGDQRVPDILPILRDRLDETESLAFPGVDLLSTDDGSDDLTEVHAYPLD